MPRREAHNDQLTYWRRIYRRLRRASGYDLDFWRDVLQAFYAHAARTDRRYYEHTIGVGSDTDLDLLIQRQIRRQGGRVCEERYKDNDDVV